jgi:hypothetical protein
MPKSKPTRSNELKRMSGTDFAMEVAKDMIVRGKAIKMLSALNETIDRETEALAKA